MNGAQIAHTLKLIGAGSELVGIRVIYRTGLIAGLKAGALIGFGSAAAAGILVYATGKLIWHLHCRSQQSVPIYEPVRITENNE